MLSQQVQIPCPIQQGRQRNGYVLFGLAAWEQVILVKIQNVRPRPMPDGRRRAVSLVGIGVHNEGGLDRALLFEKEQSQRRVRVDAKAGSAIAAGMVVAASEVHGDSSLQG